ncbi:low-density lipoprotein receptor-related protein 11 isoform X2 [Tamandua tetradactyla]|uniref:low-density lipoprotein receptor-related protein 11 isoform X2 n=1 Tax=Tamandua tetradactyla TaxID=48850 RepID=UPI00405440DA
MASAAREDARLGSRLPPRLRVLRGLLLLCLWLPRGRGTGPPSLLRGELGLRGAAEGCPGGSGGGYRVLPGAIIRPKDSLAAGAHFLRAPAGVRDGRQCAAACCSEPRCSVAVLGLPESPAAELVCYLFDCTARGRSVCTFAPHRSYTSYSLSRTSPGALEHPDASPDLDAAQASRPPENDEPPRSQAGQDVALHLPTDGLVLDGRTSSDDHAIVQYEWTLLQGDPSVDMEVPQSGMLKLSHLREGVYTFQLTVTDTAGQRSSDNVSVTVLPVAGSLPDSHSSGKNRKGENYIFKSMSDRGGVEHPAPETGAVLPLALGLAITALLLLMVACRLRLVKQKLKKARPITSEESDYLINGMYL